MNKKLLSSCAIAIVAMLGSVSATATPGLERDACIVSDTVYDQLTTMQLQYTDDIAAESYETAQTIYDQMQSLITTSCGNTDGIVSLNKIAKITSAESRNTPIMHKQNRHRKEKSDLC